MNTLLDRASKKFVKDNEALFGPRLDKIDANITELQRDRDQMFRRLGALEARDVGGGGGGGAGDGSTFSGFSAAGWQLRNVEFRGCPYANRTADGIDEVSARRLLGAIDEKMGPSVGS